MARKASNLTALMTEHTNKIKANLAHIETPLTIRQVETHLIFGPIARHIPFGYILLAVGIVSLAVKLAALRHPNPQNIGSLFDAAFFLIVPILFLRASKRQQAIVGWMAVKIAMGFGAFVMATVGAGVSFQHGDSDAWALLFLGLIWIPGVEFIPKLTPRQKYITLARILLSIPCIYFGIKSGNWHW